MSDAANLEKCKNALAEYISAVAKSSMESKHADDQIKYQVHLAQAALMFLALQKDGSVDKLRQITGMVRQAYHLNPLNGAPGKAAVAAFEAFARVVEGA